jgi:Protein of unknown function (DUF3098)
MAKQNPQQRNTPQQTTTPQRARATVIDEAPRKPIFNFEKNDELVFGKQNFLWIGIGAGLILLGLLMMLGGEQPNPETWDPNIIYNARIITFAPIIIIAGVVVEIYAIFKD